MQKSSSYDSFGRDACQSVGNHLASHPSSWMEEDEDEDAPTPSRSEDDDDALDARRLAAAAPPAEKTAGAGSGAYSATIGVTPKYPPTPSTWASDDEDTRPSEEA